VSKGGVDADACEPRPEARAALELAEVLVGLDVGLLHDLFDVAFVAHDRANGPVEAAVVATHDQLVELGLPRQNAAHHLLVAEPVGAWKDRRHHVAT
jgi:hypothetical protein